MKDSKSVIQVRDAFKEVQHGRNEGYVSCKEKLIVRQHSCKAARDEEEKLNNLQQNCPVNEFIENYSETSVKNGSMLEQEVSDSIYVSYLHIRTCE